MTPEQIGRYQIQKELGRGGMATVYQAYDPRFERTVAVKVLPRQFVHEAEFRARFTREAKVIAALEHPAIVPVYDYGEQDGQPYLVMRHMPGGSLQDRLQKGPIPIAETAVILQRIGSALDRAHSQGIIHRDLKPSNILFDQYGDAYLADFGIVRLSSASAALTASGSLMGTPSYMSPEQVYGDKELDGRSDIYALGVILFQMLTGDIPYQANTPAKIMMKHVMDPVPQILEARPDLPPACDHVITKAMAKEPDDRFATASDLSTALTAITKEMKRPDLTAATTEPEIESPAPATAEPTSDQPADEPVAEPEPDRATPEPAPPAPASTPLPPATETAVAPAADTDSGIMARVRRAPLWIWGLLAVLLLACVATTAFGGWLLSGGSFAFLSGEPTPTIVARPLHTATATVMATATTGATETPASGAESTPDSGNAGNETPASAATAEALAATRERLRALRETRTALSADDTPEAAVAAGSNLPVIFGPQDGSLPHELDNIIESQHAGVNLDDFVVRATLHNPFATTTGSWDVGIMFRQTGADSELRLVVRSDGTWNLNHRQGSEDNFMAEGNVSQYLNLNESGSNDLFLMAQAERGYFFLNDNFVTTLDLSQRTESGDIAVATGFYSDDEQEGAATSYEAFTIWPLPAAFGPRQGELVHADDGLIKSHSANVDLVNFITEANFYNPYQTTTGSWDIGFAFRQQGLADQFWLIVESDGNWSFVNRQDEDDFYLDEGQVDDLDLEAGGVNQITLVAVNEDGYFFINNDFITRLDLSERMQAGDIEIVTAFFIGNEIEGEATEYEGFTVWPLP